MKLSLLHLTRSLPIALLLGTATVKADTVTLNITGNIKWAPCTIDSPASVPINLGTLQAADLSAANSASTWEPFTLALSNCPAGLPTVSVSFAGTPDSADDRFYQNSGTATGLAVHVESTDGSSAANGQSIVQIPSANAVTFNLRARAYSVSGNVTPGTISSTITATFTLQ